MPLKTDFGVICCQFALIFWPIFADGTVRYDETIVDGLENAPQAFIDLLDRGNTGKMLVRLH